MYQIQTQLPEKRFTFRGENNNKAKGKVKLFLANGFEFLYAITALYFTRKVASKLRNSLIMYLFEVMGITVSHPFVENF